MAVDDELEKLLAKKAAKIYRSTLERMVRSRVEENVVEDPVEEIKRIVHGDRAEEIISTALELYGDTAKQVFKQLVDMYRSGQISELHDYELYQILEQLGLHVPIKTRVRIVKRGGREESIGETLENG